MLDLRLVGAALASTLAVGACDAPPPAPTAPELPPASSEHSVDATAALAGTGPHLSLPGATLEDRITALNTMLTDRGLSVALHRAEWVLGDGADPDAVTTVFADDRNLRLDTRWVPGDPRRDGRDHVVQASFGPLMVANGSSGGPLIAAGPSVDASFDTWNGVGCSALDIVGGSIVPGTFPSLILGFTGLVNDVSGVDISTVGFIPAWLFDAVLGPGTSTQVAGVTFTFIWVDPLTGEPTDIDADGRTDTSFKEVWYNDGFPWSDGTVPGIDIETVALHENGHALELGHFGKIRVTNGKLHVSPRAVMNAVILGVLRDPLGTDNSAYCGNFASWPG